MNLHELLNGFSKPKSHRRNPRRMSRLKQSEVFEDRCLLTAGVGQFLGGQVLETQASLGVALGDLDGDGDLDAFVATMNDNNDGEPADWTGAANRVFINDGGVFTDSGQTLGNGVSLQVELGDLDGDGDLDAFVGNIGGNKVWLNDGSGGFTDSGLSLGAGMSLDVSLGDLDGDGDLDVAVSNGAFVPGLSTAGEIWINDGAASPGFTNTASGIWGDGAFAEVALGDVDGDGDLDAVLTRFEDDNGNAGHTVVFTNDGSGTFTDSGQQLGPHIAFGVELGDFDGDGDLDAFVVHNDREGDRVYVNQGGAQSGTEGVFVDSGQRLELERDGFRLDIADLDGDGDLDVFAVAGWYTGAEQGSRVYINQGGDQAGTAGVFASNGQQLGGDDDTAVALGDIDGNGTVDALVVDFAGQHRIWLNQEFPLIGYEANGNVSIHVPDSEALLKDAPGGVTISAVDHSETVGAVNVQPDGSFTYTPATGFVGADLFTVTRTDDEVLTVIIDVSDPFWFVDQNAAPGGDGSLLAPFQSLAPLNADGTDPDDQGDLIFINGAGTYDIANAGGFGVEYGQTLLTSWSNPFSQLEFMQNIGHPIAEFSFGLPNSFTGRPTIKNSTSNAPVFRASGENFLSSFNVTPEQTTDIFQIHDVNRYVYLHNIEVTPESGDHNYDVVSVKNASGVVVDLYDFDVMSSSTSTNSGTVFNIDSSSEIEFRAHSGSQIQQRGGGLLNVTNTTNSSGNGKIDFDVTTSLSIFGGEFGFNLQNNVNGKFGFDGDFFLIDVTSGITAINSGTIEMPLDLDPAERDVSANGGFALQVEHTSTGEDGWHLDQVNAWGGTGGILFDDVGGGGIHINQTEIISASQLAVDVSDTPNTVFDFGELMIMGDNLITETWVGNGTAGRAGDGGESNDAELNLPSDVTFDRHGNMFITDFAENVVRRMDVITETMTTIAGTGTAGFSGDGGLATSAELNGPLAVVVDHEGNVFIADAGNHRIRRIDAATGIITTVAGTGTGGFGGDSGPATSASLNFPVDLAFADDGSLFISDHENHRIRRIDGETGIITTAVGTGEAGVSPEDTPPTSAKLNLPWGIAFIANGQLGIADSGNNRMVGVDWDDNSVFTMVGTGVPGNNGDQSNDPRQFQLDDPRGLAVHPDGVILITDYNNHRVVGLNPLEESVETLGGNGTAGYAGDNMPVENAQFNEPISVAVAPWGDIAVADVLNHRVRGVFFDFSAGEGIVLENNPGSTFNFERLSVRATTKAFVAGNSGTINVGGNHVIYGDNAMLQAENGRALDVWNTTLSNGEGGPATFRHVLSVLSPGDGIILDNVSGDLIIESGLIYHANQSGDPETAGIFIEGGSGDITIYATVANSSGQSVTINGRTGGDIHLVTPIYHDVDGTSAIVIENNIDGSTTFYRPLDINSGSAPAVVQNNNGNHVVTFLTEGFPPDDDDVRVFDVSPFERLEPLGSLVAISGTEVEVAAGETIEFDVDLQEDQVLSGFVDSFGGSSLANLTVEIVGLTGVLTAEEFVVLPPQSIEASGTYIVRVTSDAAVTTELVLILNAGFEIPDSSDGNELAIDNTHGGETSGRWAAVGITNGSTTVPDADEFTIDLTEYVGQSIDVIVTGFEGQHYEDQTLELLAPDGTTVLATGTATPVGGVNATNLDLAIFDFEVPAAGVYTARVTAPFDDVAYTLMVGYGLTFDAEPNNDRTSDALRAIAPNNVALGHLDAATDAADFYEIALVAGESVTLSTGFAFDPNLSPINTLNPELELFRPDGSSLASDADSGEGVHAQIAFTVAETGTFVVRIGATAGSGDYVLQTEVTPPPPDNQAPIANAGGPYRISENDSLALNASASSDPDGNPLTYRWDVNGDGSFDENITGAQPSLTWSQLLALGIPAEASTRAIAVEVSDGSLVDTDQAFLIIESVDNPVALSGTLSEGYETAGTQITITATANRAVDGDQTVDVVVTGDGITTTDFGLSNAQITILNGQTTGSIVFTVLDDDDIENTEMATVSIANPSAGIVLGSTTANTVSIVSDDVPTLAVSIDKVSISEDGDTATVTVTRNGSNAEALVVNIGSNDHSEIAIPANVIIEAGSSTATFDITGQSDSLLDGTRTASVVVSAAGFVQGVSQIDVLDTDVPELRVELSAASISEAGSVQVTVIRNTGGEGANGLIIVTDGTEVSYPETVEIVNNTDRVTFIVHGVVDGLVDGTQAIEIYASHPDFTSIPTTLLVTDVDTGQLSLDFDPGTISENGGTTTGTVTRNTPTTEAMTVDIALSTAAATSVTSVEIPAGQSSATFTVTGVDDAISNGSRDVTITASADDLTSASKDITVADDDAVGIVSITAVHDADEFEAVNGTFLVEMTTASSVDTVINIAVTGTATSGADYIALPTSVTIPAGLLSATLTIPVVNDSDAEDDETVIVTLTTIVSANATLDEDLDFDVITVADNDRDLITPTATVRTLPLSTNTATFLVTTDIEDPASTNGQPISGVASYDLFVAVDGGAFTLYAGDVPATQTTVEFTPQSNHRYWFKAVATDNAGNVEDSSPAAETNTYVGDVTAPETSVVTATADTATGEITLNISGTDAGNSGLDQFFVYVSIDDGPVQEIPASSIAAGTADNGTYSQSVTFQGFRDGVQHTYRFFTRGLDGANNLEAASPAGDVTVTETFAAPSNGLEANGIDVQNGETQRSYIRNVDVLFNDVNGLQDLIDNDRIQIERFDLSDNTPDVGTGSLVSPTSASVNGNAIKLDFGSTGLGGSGNTGNGFYRIAIDVDGDGLFDDAAFEFFRLWGDSNGDGQVTNADRTATEDVNGDGRVNSRDRIVYRTERGKKLHNDLFPELDD